ncbi:hypothetical protein J2X32_000033 [Rheinheimera pacifica]|uniref:SIR2 family protein n=1 Tax=Rheinheimera pacifica TaxID=173990 RepID=UPI002864E8C1|nr:SIR2 family protein [Rheinheimera pacifica]MDR6981425.1 hypothetical protein [Rheinheimera pacifica]
MRFSENCFDIPDDLIQAHEQGQVVFFCGSGVSRAADRLPDFWGLAEKVVDDLRAAQDSDARRFLLSAKKIRAKHPELSSATTADQLFSLLELEFLTEDIERSVLKALIPSGNVNLIFHKTILELAKTHNGRTQLVTTNFDRIFEQADSSLETWVAPTFPELEKGALFDGIVYLHGRATADYSSSDGHDVILNTADFGHAYISDGWATRFFKQVVEQYIVVFIGYSADDPPINFLLRALKKYRGKIKGLYAFESGSQQIATERWSHKGVVGIAFPDGDYDCLWRTLEEWTKFHNRKDEWFSELFHKASVGPAVLKPFEREHVAFLAKSVEGVKRILGATPALSADWLCVFDRNRRYAERSYTPMDETDSKPTAFSLYGLATDPIAQIAIADASPLKKIEHIMPLNAWHAFQITKGDFDSDGRYENLVDGLADEEYELPERLLLLSIWIAQNIDHPACLWWAQLRSGSIHRQLKQRLSQEILYPRAKNLNIALRQEWLKLTYAWQNTVEPHQADWYRLEKSIVKYGWSALVINGIAECLKPRLKVKSYTSDSVAPLAEEEYLLNIEVGYPDVVFDLEVPQEYLPSLIGKIRDNLILSTELECFTSGHQRLFINSLTPDPSLSQFTSSYGINSLIQIFLNLFDRLKQCDIDLAQQEYFAWPVSNEAFSLLKVWAARDPLLSDSADFGSLINKGLQKEQFWTESLSREIHLSLKERWAGLSEDDKKAFCSRLLIGCSQSEWESEKEWNKRRAFNCLSSIHWMQSNNCELPWISESDISELKTLDPDWQPEDADGVARSTGVFGGVVQTNTDYRIFDGLSKKEIIHKAIESSGRELGSLVENKPFQGLSNDNPSEALSIIKFQLQDGDFTSSLWRDFFSYRTRDRDTAELSCSIAETLLLLENVQLSEISHIVFRWFHSAQMLIAIRCPAVLTAIRLKLFNFLVQQKNENDLEIDNVGNAINQPAGMFVKALIETPEIENKFMPDFHLEMISSLINKTDDDSKMALVLCSARLTWFYHHNPKWTKNNLLSKLSSSSEIQIIFWIGFLWTAQPPKRSLFRKIKVPLLELAKSNVHHRRGLTKNLARMVLSGWLPFDPAVKSSVITDKELLDVLLKCDDELRTSLLWNLRRWTGEDKSCDWHQVCYRLFHYVWPKQKALKTEETNNYLYNFLLSRKENFDHYFNLIFPLVTANRSPRLDFFKFERLEDSTSGPLQYPELTLKFLRKILPYDSRDWLYGAEEYIKYFIANRTDLAKNSDLDELAARLNRR